MEGASVMSLQTRPDLEVAAVSPYFPRLQSVLRLVDPMMLMMDSGSFAHVCPLSFMPSVPLRQ
eukprot:5567893-Heterocapsa_arctica.AAC.1